MTASRKFVFEVVFDGDAAGAKAAAAEVKAAIAGVTSASQTTTGASDREAAAIQKTTDARRRAAQAAREQAAAEKAVGEAARRTPAPAPAPAPAPVPAGPTPAEIEAMRAKYVPLFGASQAYRRELADLDKAKAAGALSDDEMAAAQNRLRQRYDWTTAAIRRTDDAIAGAGKRMHLQSHEARILSMQMTDTVQSLALGMSPLQVLMQQGPQVVDILGGVGRTLQFIRQTLTGTRVLIGGTAAAVIGGALAWDQYLVSMKAADVAAAGRGRRLGMTGQELAAQGMAGAWVGGLSVSRGEELAGQLASNGIGRNNIYPLVAMARDLAVTMQTDPDQAGQLIAGLFGKPGEGAQQLYAGGLIDAAALEQVQRLARENGRDQAQAALIAALRPNLASADAASSGLRRAWDATWNFGSNVWYGAGAGVAALTGTGPDEPIDVQLAELQQRLGRLQSGGRTRGRAAEVSRVQAEIARLTALQAQQAAQSTAVQNSAFGPLALDLAARAPVNARALQERALRGDIDALNKGLMAPDLSPDQRADITRAIDGQTRALAALTDRKQLALSLDQRDLQLATERNPMRRAEIAGLQAFVRAAAEGTDIVEAFNAAEQARRRTLNETLAGASNQAAAMAEEAAAREKLNGLQAAGLVSSAEAETWLERELTLRPLIAAAASAEGAEKQALEAEIRKLEKAYDGLAAARQRETVIADRRATADRIADLQRETAQIGQTPAERIRGNAAAEAERWIRDQGLDPGGMVAWFKRLFSSAAAEAEIELNRRQREYARETDRRLSPFDLPARLAVDPVQRAAIEAEREYTRVLAETGDAEEAAAAAARVRRRAVVELQGSLADLVRSQDEGLERLRLEARLAPLTEAARARMLALFEAEIEIRHLGAAPDSAEAERIRQNAEATAAQARETERLADAWGKVRESAEGAIDGPIDALLNGKPEDALSSFADEVKGLFVDLAFKNPIKNGLFGTDYATMQDVGGLKGLWAGLFGGGEAAALVSGAAGQTVGAMQVTAGTVVIGGGGVAGLFGGAAGDLMGGGLAANGQAMAILSGVATGGGARADAISGLSPALGNPLAAMVARAQGLFGADAVQVTSGFRSNERQAQLWAEALAKYGSPEAARKWVAPPGQSRHNVGLAADLQFGSPEVQQWFHQNAGQFGLGFRMANEPWHIEPQGAASMMQAAQAATKFGTAADTATGQLGTLGNGFGSFGQFLAQALSGGAGGGGFLQTLISLGAQAFGIPGFAGGGRHRGGLRVVGENGPELEYTGPSTILPADLTRALMTSKAPMLALPEPANSAPPMQVIVHNYSGQPVQTEERTDAQGRRTAIMTIGEQGAAALRQPGNPMRQAMERQYGAKPRGIVR